MTNDYQSQLQKVESDIQSLEAVKKDLKQKIKEQARSEKSKQYRQVIEDIKQLIPEFHKNGYELTVVEPDDMFYMMNVTLKEYESGCTFVYDTLSGFDDAVRALPVLQHILRASCRSLDTIVVIAQRVYEVYEFQEDTVQNPFEINYLCSKTLESDHFELSFVYHGSYHGLSRDINITMTFATEDSQPFILSITTDLSESTEMAHIRVPNFPYKFDVSASTGCRGVEGLAKVQLSHFETLDPKKPNLEGNVVDTVRDFARTAEKLIVT